MHRVYLPGMVAVPGEVLSIDGQEAIHALRVKRIEAGEPVGVLDGAGHVAIGKVIDETGSAHAGAARGGGRRSREQSLLVMVEKVRAVDAVMPTVHVWAATPKGSAVDEMLGGLCQAGAASWTPMRTERSVVDPRSGKVERLERLAVEASKQCGRAWLMHVHSAGTFNEAIAGNSAAKGERVVIADASGDGYTRTGAAAIRLLIGPEGGWSTAELERARAAGAHVCAFGPHIMRIEVAAVVATGIVLDRERGSPELHARHPAQDEGDAEPLAR